MQTITQPDFNKFPDLLVPCIVQDALTGKVLMLGYMNEAAWKQTSEKKLVTFFSRSKKRLWTKGETSGNFLSVETMLLDCDADSILVKAHPAGPVCHTGKATCFNENNEADFLQQLETILEQRKTAEPGASSYVADLYRKGINKIAQKVGEEAVELVIEAVNTDMDLFREEAADLLFHYLLLLHAKGISLQEVKNCLRQRHV